MDTIPRPQWRQRHLHNDLSLPRRLTLHASQPTIDVVARTRLFGTVKAGCVAIAAAILGLSVPVAAQVPQRLDFGSALETGLSIGGGGFGNHDLVAFINCPDGCGAVSGVDFFDAGVGVDAFALFRASPAFAIGARLRYQSLSPAAQFQAEAKNGVTFDMSAWAVGPELRQYVTLSHPWLDLYVFETAEYGGVALRNNGTGGVSFSTIGAHVGIGLDVNLLNTRASTRIAVGPVLDLGVVYPQSCSIPNRSCPPIAGDSLAPNVQWYVGIGVKVLLRLTKPPAQSKSPAPEQEGRSEGERLPCADCGK